ncbi:MAG: ATP-binding cassette domain-containing protein [Candidatus Binataceae bacterium]
MSGEIAIAAVGLRKRFGTRAALDGISLRVAPGEIVGLLGPNGAGKTSTLSILAGVIAPDSGNAQICGYDLLAAPADARRRLGLVPQSLALYPTLTARENLEFFGRIQRLRRPQARDRAHQLLEVAGLSDRADHPVAAFSGGMKRRLNLACGMIHSPAALLLDEATAGVDPQSRERIFSVVQDAAARGAAVLYSTHYMEEVERLSPRVVLIDHGRVVAEGSVPELIARAGAEPRIELRTLRPLAIGWIAGLDGVRELARDESAAPGASLLLRHVGLAAKVLERAAQMGGEVTEFLLHRPNLQDAFIALTGHALRDEP